MNVIDLDARRPHSAVPMRCTDCGHGFISVHRSTIKREFWECPKCHEIAAKEDPNG